MESQPTLSSRIHHQNCPVCKSDNIAFALKATDHTVSKEEFEVWHCSNCQGRFTQDTPDESEIGAYYESEEYISHSNTNRGLINTLYQQVRSYTLGQKRRLIQKVSGLEKGDILDIGCGTGEFLNEMKSHGWETLGLEPSPVARKQAIDRFGLAVEPSEKLFDLDQPQDVITMWHVLEHVHRLHDYLDKIKELLQPGGRFLVAVPNYQSSDAEAYQAEWAAYDVPRHLYHFSPPAMEKLMESHGFTIRKLHQMPFDAFYVAMLSEKYRKGKVRLVPAVWQGGQSWLKTQLNKARGSSVLYEIGHV